VGSSLEISFFVSEPPEITYRDGLFFVAANIGGERIERVFTPHAFARAVWRAEQALALFRSGQNVVEFGPKVRREDAANG
jgi:hypothetical protein